ncbi:MULTISPECIES: hypothetical protein [unclassified Streptomyces]|nr:MULTISPECIES: hypothetical protein [unclassified Streptomyces]MYQ41662.1 hypothetical protein [Streptomyces sp. SID4921]
MTTSLGEAELFRNCRAADGLPAGTALGLLGAQGCDRHLQPSVAAVSLVP